MCEGQERPQFEHDCSNCIFLGRYVAAGNGPCDLYVHPASDPGLRTVLARYSSADSDNQCGLPLVGVIDEITEAHRRAVARGLLPAG